MQNVCTPGMGFLQPSFDSDDAAWELESEAFVNVLPGVTIHMQYLAASESKGTRRRVDAYIDGTLRIRDFYAALMGWNTE